MTEPTRSWASATTHLGIGDLTAKIHTNKLLRAEGGLSFHSKGSRTASANNASTCVYCQARILFDGIVWQDHGVRDHGRRHVCPTRGSSQIGRLPHLPMEFQLKELARAQVFASITRIFQGRPLSLLSLPGAEWLLERQLLAEREGTGQWRTSHESQTGIIGVESLDPIYRAGSLNMPGREQGLQTLIPPEFASYALATRKIPAYYRADVMQVLPNVEVAAAWIDLTGPVSSALMDALNQAWTAKRIYELLIITSFKGRWGDGLGNEIATSGGLTVWMENQLETEAIETFEYADPGPMHQIVFHRTPDDLPNNHHLLTMGSARAALTTIQHQRDQLQRTIDRSEPAFNQLKAEVLRLQTENAELKGQAVGS